MGEWYSCLCHLILADILKKIVHQYREHTTLSHEMVMDTMTNNNQREKV